MYKKIDMTDNPVLELDGRFLYYTFLAGGNKILQHQADLNRINVFPVSDKDTGTNMASTIRSILDKVKPETSFSETFKKISEAALVGARGNSGIIFAQFLHSFSRETQNSAKLSLSEFADALKKSVPGLYGSISNPAEGTMLTVIREWSDYLHIKKNKFTDYKHAILDSINVLQKSLLETNQKLEALKNTKLVDAGAKGFVLFIEGIVEFIKCSNIRKCIELPVEVPGIIHSEDIPKEHIHNRYCTEAVIRDTTLNRGEIENFLKARGDSIVIAGSSAMTRIHVHTNEPSELFYKLKDHGTITLQKVDDMVRQQDMAFNRKWKIALVTDSTCDLPEELIEKYQINIVPLNINFGERHFLDKITIKPHRFYDMLETEDVFPTTSQINEASFVNIYSQLASHYDSIISVHLTGKFSGTYESAVSAGKVIEKEFGVKVGVVDSRTLSGALGLLVLEAANLIEKGKSHDEIIKSVESNRINSKIYVSVKTLKYMVKGGRVSKGKGAIANMLGINPIVSMDEEGNSTLMGSTFSQKANINKVIKTIKRSMLTSEIESYIILHAHNENAANIYKNKMKEITGIDPVGVVNISPVIGMNAGLGTAAVSVKHKQN